jgi:hypothetical protein
MRRILVFVSVFLSLWLTLRAESATYYVSTSGDDSNSCSAAQAVGTAKRNPSNGAGCLSPGDTLYIRAGTYNVGLWSGPPGGNSESQRVTIAGYPPDGSRQAILNFFGNGNGLDLGAGQQYITFDNLVIDGSGVTNAVIKLTGTPTSGAHHINFTNGEIRRGGQGLQDGPTEGNQGILIGGPGSNLVSNMSIHDNGNSVRVHGIYVRAPNNIWEKNDIFGHAGFGIHNYEGSDEQANNNNISRGNRLHRNAVGLLLSYGQNQKAYNNVIYENTAWAVQSYAGSGHIFVNNTVYNNAQDAFNIGSDAIMCNNITFGNGNNNASGTSNLNSNPGLANPGAGDVHLNENATTAINQGTSSCQVSSLVTTDFYGNTRPVGGAWDIGAAEFGGTGPPTCPNGCTCTITPGVCDTPPVVTQEPIAWWKFDEGVGTTASDFTSGVARPQHTGTLVGGTTWTPGRVGSFAVQLDGVNDAVTIPDSVLTAWGADQSMCLWAQVANTTMIGSGNFKQTLVNLSADSTNGVRLAVNDVSTPPGQWWVTILAGGTKIAAGTSAAAFTNNNWVHLCYTLASSVLKLYVNSVQATTLTNDSFDPALANVLGGRDATTGNLGGMLDNVKIWSRALSAAEIVTEFGGAVGRISHRGMFK